MAGITSHVSVTIGFTGMLMLIALLPCASDAAIIVMKNGDRITGQVVKMEDKKLEVDPDYSSDNVTIDWEDVQSLTTERPMLIQLYGDVIPNIPDNVGQHIRDRIILYTLEDGGPIRLKDVRSINFAEKDYRGDVSIGGNQTSGNTQTQALNVSGTFSYHREENRITLDAKYNRAEADGETTANNGSVGVKHDYFLANRLYSAAFNFTETDQFQDLTMRNTTGLGLGYDLIDRRQHLLTVAVGPAAVYQDFTPRASIITPSAAWIVRYEIRFRNDNVILWHKQMGFKDLGHGSAIRVNADQGIKIKIAGRWRANLEYDIRFNSQPVTGGETTDTSIIFGISYEIKP